MFFQFVLLLILLIPQEVQTIELANRAEPGIECQCPADRTLFSIIWNCISTTIVCAWVSVHPNVPPSGQWRGLWRRLQAMFWTIIAPELILAWAVRQWFAAWVIRDAINGADEGLIKTLRGWLGIRNETGTGRRWTMAHGHLLGMGGITTVDPAFERDDSNNPNGEVLTLDRYRALRANQDAFELPKITTADIKDKSKGDLLSKLIAILQTTWFIVQCVARRHQNLALTELELVTLALASLNAITYAFWWHKPLEVEEPIRIYVRSETRPEERRSDAFDNSLGISADNILSRVGGAFGDMGNTVLDFLLDPCQGDGDLCTALINLIIGIPLFLFILFFLGIFLPFPFGITLLLKVLKTNPITEDPEDGRGLIAARINLALRKIRYQVTSYAAGIAVKWLKEFLDDTSFSAFFINWLFLLPTLFFVLLATTICFLPFFTLLFLISFIFTSVFGIITSNIVAPGATHVPSFYAPTTDSDKYSRMLVFAFFGVIFGGLHCIGWNFLFVTPLEHHLWRATSVAITAIPVVVAPIDYILENSAFNNEGGKVVHLLLDLVMTILLFIYVPARLSLIAQALALLRHQPESAFLGVDWTKYIPHIF